VIIYISCINFTRLFNAFNEIHGFLVYSAKIRQFCIASQTFEIGGNPLFFYQISNVRICIGKIMPFHFFDFGCFLSPFCGIFPLEKV